MKARLRVLVPTVVALLAAVVASCAAPNIVQCFSTSDCATDYTCEDGKCVGGTEHDGGVTGDAVSASK